MCAHHVGMCQQALWALQPQPGARPERERSRPGSGRWALRAARMCRHAVAMRMRLLLLLVIALLVAPKGVHLLLYRSALRWRAWKALPALVLVPGTPGHLHLRQSLCRAPQS